MIKAVLTCFHGPSVESTFNLMDVIVSESRTSLNIESLDSLQTVKYYLNSLNASTCEVFGSKDPVHEPIQRDFGYNLINSWAAYQQSLLLKNSSKTASTSHNHAISQNQDISTLSCSPLPPKIQISPLKPNSEEEKGKKKLFLDNKSKKSK